jgi:hypothetical protein
MHNTEVLKHLMKMLSDHLNWVGLPIVVKISKKKKKKKILIRLATLAEEMAS